MDDNPEPNPPAKRHIPHGYERTWEQYRAFVEQKRLAGALNPSDKWLTRENVDKFFQEDVVNRKILPKSARKIASALQWYSTNEEYVDDDNPLKIRTYKANSKVEQALNQHANNCKERYETGDHDAHANLPTNVLSVADHRKVLNHIFGSSKVANWKDMAFAWTCTNDTFLRLDSLRKMKLQDLRLDKTHGPAEEGSNARVMSYILQPLQHKDDKPGGNAGNKNKQGARVQTNYKKRIVGTWRHKEYFRCSTGILAKLLFARFNCEGEPLSFTRPAVEGRRPQWQTQPLLTNWNSPSAPSAAYHSVYQACGVKWAKLTHLRHSAMENASSRGELPADQLATLSKHRGDRLFDAYITELFPPVLKAMAGFGPRETYFVGRTEVSLPFEDEEAMVRAVFPRIGVWRDEVEDNGDRHESAKNFLFQTLPFLARVLLEDGPYWLRDFPNHISSNQLRECLPNRYLDWARREAIPEATRIEQARKLSLVDNLNEAAREGFHLMATQMEELNKRFKEQQQQYQVLCNELRMHRERMDAQLAMLHHQQQVLQQQQQVVFNQDQNQDQNQVANVAPPIQQPQVQNVPQPPPVRNNPPANALGRLRQVVDARVPPFRDELPGTLLELLLEHQRLNLSSYKTAKKTHWHPNKKVQYSRRMYLYSKIEEKANNPNFRSHLTNMNRRLNEAARELDDDRRMLNDMTLPAFLKHLKSTDRNVRKRRARREGI